MYFGFVDDVMFSYNGENGPESKTTRMLRRVRQLAAPGAKSAVSDCILSVIRNKHVNLLCILCTLCNNCCKDDDDDESDSI